MTFAWEQPTAAVAPRYAVDYRFEEMAALFQSWGFKRGNAERAFSAVYRGGINDYRELEGILPRGLLDRLTAGAMPLDPVARVEVSPSEDGSTKFVFHFHRGDAVEGVFMPFGKRTTLCISSQVGCAMGCTFCATGVMGFRRHLSAGEMVSQVLHMLKASGGTTGRGDRVNVVFMGMGEPLHNLDGVLAVYDILTHRHGLVLSERDVAVSTSGLVSRIQKLGGMERRPQLMVSIAATTDEARSALMPVNRAWPLEDLLKCLEAFPLRKRERIMLSYVIIAGKNDSDEDAERLAAMAARFPSLVNLIPMNAHDDAPGMIEPAEERLQRFYRTLLDKGAFATIRRSRGRDVAGACGQLVKLQVASQ